jgi:hypothetical protein
MGILRSDDDHALIALGARTLIGRAAHCAVRIDDRQISAEHAALRWTGKEWQLRDLGSRNGTFVDGERLESGRGRALSSGVSVRFGPQRGFVLAHDGPPGAAAARETDQLLRVSEAEILSLPSADGMLAIVYEGSDGRWIVEQEGLESEAEHGQGLVLAEESWRLILPVAPRSAELPTTWDTSLRPRLETIALTLRVSQDQEHVDVEIKHRGGAIVLSSRVHHLVTLALARARLEDVSAGVRPAEVGWRYADELSRMLSLEPGLLTLHLFRAREQVAQAGIEGAARLFERRRLSGQVRIAVEQITIVNVHNGTDPDAPEG